MYDDGLGDVQVAQKTNIDGTHNSTRIALSDLSFTFTAKEYVKIQTFASDDKRILQKRNIYLFIVDVHSLNDSTPKI